MLRAIEWVRRVDDTRRLGGIGLWYPSPSEYNPLAFLASLSDSLGTEIDRWYRRSSLVQRRRRIEKASVFSVVALTLAGVGSITRGPIGSTTATVAIALLAAGLVGISVGLVLRARPVSFAQERRLAREAKLVRERARYTATHRETSEIGAEGGRGLIARARTERARELVERPATLSSLVNDFRALAREAGQVAGRVVIAIDELDKMADPKTVRDLLRDIKGIFEVPHVHFLVSVSDEAVRSLSLGALWSRDEFNSSFYTVIEAQPATPEDIAELLQRRSQARVPREVALVLGVLAGGNPREALRLAELAATATTGAEAVAEALKHEALALRREVVTAVEDDELPALQPKSRVGAFVALPDASFASPNGISALANNALGPQMWEPEWRDPGFDARFGEAWCRLMLRLAVGAQLAESQTLVRNPELGERLRDAVVAASQSAEVGRVFLERELRIETVRPVVEPGTARQRLIGLARDYEKIRDEHPEPSQERTALMEAVASNARALGRAVALSSEEFRTMLSSSAPGDRLVALACVSATGDPGVFEEVLTAAIEPPSWFEGNHALRALETLLPSLTPAQQKEVSQRLSSVLERLTEDPPRAALASRILDGLLRRAAEGGDVAAMSNLGLALRDRGQSDEAEHWLRQAAEGGDVAAMYTLGLALRDRGESDEAEHWLRRSAEGGDVAAMSNLGLALRDRGQSDEAEHWLRQAAEGGDVAAMYTLGLALRDRGESDEAEHWLRRSAEGGDLAAARELARPREEPLA